MFLTGHTGFKGGWLGLWLEQLGARVTGYALPADTTPNLFDAAKVGDHLSHCVGDIRDTSLLERALSAARPEIVIHMAAQPLVRRGYAEPALTFQTNVMGTVNVLEAAMRCQEVRAVLVVTSDKVYEERISRRAYKEDDALGGPDPYSASKGCADIVARAYRFGLTKRRSAHPAMGIATARSGNVLGGGDWSQDRLVPDLVRAFQRGESPRIRYPTATRPWQHVLDPLRGYLLLVQATFNNPGDTDLAWNFGPAGQSARTVGWIASYLARKWDSSLGWTTDGGDHPREAEWLGIDSFKASELLRWQPLLDIERTLDWTIDWYQKFADGCDAYGLVLTQLGCYTQLLADDGRALP